MFCVKCGATLPDDAVYCSKCGAKQTPAGADKSDASSTSESPVNILAGSAVQELKCPGCGAPIKPQFGEMVISCEYCGSTVSLVSEGWKSIEKHSMLPIVLQTQDMAISSIKGKMDRGLLHRHLEEESKMETLNLGYIPYWIVPVSARTNYTAVDAAAEAGKFAATAAIIGLAGGAFGGGRGRGGLGMGLVEGTMIGGMMMGGGGYGGGGTIRAYTLNENYNHPVVAVKSMNQYQPRDYSFGLDKRIPFDAGRISKGIKVLNGDVSEDSAKHIAKTNVEQIQAEKAHETHHMIRSIKSDSDVSDPELLHVPVWFAKFDYKGNKIVLVVDGSSGGIINSIGLS